MDDFDATPAMEQVFTMPELVENIILQMPEREILANAQRVSSMWRDLVHISFTIQEKLHMATKKAVINPVAFQQPTLCTPIYDSGFVSNPYFVRSPATKWQPLKPSLRPPLASVHWRPNPGGCVGIARNVWLTLDPPHQTKLSWYGMFLTDPPISTVNLDIRAGCSQSGVADRVALSIYDPQGIRMGVVDDLVKKVWRDLRSLFDKVEPKGGIQAGYAWLTVVKEE